METDSKVAVVAGGSAGVGRAVVERLIDRGYRVGVLARGQARREAISEEFGARAMPLRCDVSDARSVARAGAAVHEAFGPISVWVNSAMLTSFSPFAAMPSDEFDAILDTTLTGTVNGTRTALSLMEPQNKGRIVNIGSGLAYRAVPYQSAYCTAKHGINGFNDALRTELIREGADITISAVQMPALNTPQFEWARNRLPKRPRPAAPVFSPDLAARAVMKAIDTGARELLVGRSVLKLVFGQMVLPAWLDRKLADDGAELQKSERRDPGGRADNLETPVEEVASTAQGSYGREASSEGLIVDGTHARVALFGGALAVSFLIGLVVG